VIFSRGNWEIFSGLIPRMTHVFVRNSPNMPASLTAQCGSRDSFLVPQMKQMIGTEEAARARKITTGRIRLLAETGRIPGATKVSGVWLIPASGTAPIWDVEVTPRTRGPKLRQAGPHQPKRAGM
jgi:hypothetical protein